MSSLVGGLLTGAGLLGGIAALTAKVRLSKEKAWETTPGSIEESRVDYRSEAFYPVVIYTFTHEGRVFQGKRICSLEITGNWRSTADKWVRRYPIGSTVTVFVDPSDPSNSVLEPGGDRKFLPIALLVSVTIVVVGVVNLINS